VDSCQDIFAHDFKQGMAGSDPLQGGVLLQQFLVEDDVAVFAPKFAEAGFQAFADGPQIAGDATELVGVEFGLDGLG
jgi:hypothetical protein